MRPTSIGHIPLFDSDPTHNPGDVAPADKDPQYTADFAFWQRTCGKMWGPLLHKAKCQLLITAHMHLFRYDAPEKDRCWAQLVGGGSHMEEVEFPTVMEGKVQDGKLCITVHNIYSGKIHGTFVFPKRK